MLGGPGYRPVMVQRESAEQLIDRHTGVLGGLDEEDLAHELADGLPGNSGLVSSVLETLDEADRDDVVEYIVPRVPKSSLSQDLRIRFIEILQGGGWVTDTEEGQIADLWNSFGEELPAVASRFERVWATSIRESDQLNELPHIVRARALFRHDVVGLAKHYLDDNASGVQLEAEKLGISPGEIGAPQSGRPQVLEPDYAEGMIRVARDVAAIRDRTRELRQIVVGTKWVIGSQYAGRHQVRFDPEQRPQVPNVDSPTWDEVNEQYQQAMSVVRGFANLYPSIYVLLQQDRLDELTNAGGAQEARATLASTLAETLSKIRQAKAKLVSGSISFEDLIPVQQQLLTGAPAAEFKSSHAWDTPFYRGIAEDLLEDKEAEDFWTDLGLSLVAAGALIAAPFTGGVTLGLLVGLGVGIGAGQAVRSWQEYENLATASQANISDELSLVSEGQVTAALTEAVINSLAAFLDLFGARAATTAGRAIRGAATEAGGREARRRALREARRDVALELAASGAGVGMHIVGSEDEPPSVRLDEAVEIPLHPLHQGAASSVNRLPIQRQEWRDYEKRVIRALRRGEVGNLPVMDYVIEGMHGSGQGLDAIGIHIHAVGDETKGFVNMYRFEIKHRQVAQLDAPSAGTQLGRAWTVDAIDKIFARPNLQAAGTRDKIIGALREMYSDEDWDAAKAKRWIKARLVNSRPIVVVPDFSDLTRLWRQMGGLNRHLRRAARVIVHP